MLQLTPLLAPALRTLQQASRWSKSLLLLTMLTLAIPECCTLGPSDILQVASVSIGTARIVSETVQMRQNTW